MLGDQRSDGVTTMMTCREAASLIASDGLEEAWGGAGSACVCICSCAVIAAATRISCAPSEGGRDNAGDRRPRTRRLSSGWNVRFSSALNPKGLRMARPSPSGLQIDGDGSLALVLAGGGARAAYQVGALAGIAERAGTAHRRQDVSLSRGHDA